VEEKETMKGRHRESWRDEDDENEGEADPEAPTPQL